MAVRLNLTGMSSVKGACGNRPGKCLSGGDGKGDGKGDGDEYADIIKATNTNITENYQTASEYGENGELDKFVDKVRTGGDWDFKKDKGLNKRFGDRMQKFGNWHFGYVAQAFGFNLVQRMSGAGAYQMLVQGGGSAKGLYGSILINAFTSGGIMMPNALTLALTNAGFSWGDNTGDALDISKGWIYANK